MSNDINVEFSCVIISLPNQVSAGQNVHLSGDFKSSHVSVASNQFFSNHQQQQNSSGNNNMGGSNNANAGGAGGPPTPTGSVPQGKCGVVD